MPILSATQNIFDLNDSDHFVGSYLLKSDIMAILNVSVDDLKNVNFITIEGNEVCDEKTVRTLWKQKKIPNSVVTRLSNLDELFLIPIIKKTYPEMKIERQIKVKRYSMDLKLTLQEKEIFIEFNGPHHFIHTRYGIPKDPFYKKKIVEDITGIEVINWPYWIQRCTSNIKAIFEKDIDGYGVLWNAEMHFGMFFFENSAQIIEVITKRFNAVNKDGYGYIYGPNTRGRNNPQHPIIENIKSGKNNINLILPKGYKDRNYWLPDDLI